MCNISATFTRKRPIMRAREPAPAVAGPDRTRWLPLSNGSRGVCQIPNGVGLAGMGVVVAVLSGVQDGGDGLEGGVADLGADGDLAAGLVPQDGQVEGGEQLGFEPWCQPGQDVSGERELVQERGVGGGWGGLGQSVSWASRSSRSSWSSANRARMRAR
jgi:hypothetical protein